MGDFGRVRTTKGEKSGRQSIYRCAVEARLSLKTLLSSADAPEIRCGRGGGRSQKNGQGQGQDLLGASLVSDFS